jgi:hypothetical protein
VSVAPTDRDQTDNDIDFEVAIAPNTVKDSGSVELEAAAESPAALWESTAAQTLEDFLAGFQNWRTPRRGQELGQTLAVPVSLAEISVRRNRRAAERFIEQSPATAKEKADALSYVQGRISAAAEAQEEVTIYRRLREVASRIQRLYGGRAQFALDVEHLTEVAQHPQLYARTRISRRYAAVASRIRNGSARSGTPEAEIMSMTSSPAQKRQIARLYAEQLVDESLGDVGETLGLTEAVEIEIEIITQAVHQAVTARRAAERAGST